MDLHLDILLNLVIRTYFLDSRCMIVFTDDNNVFNYIGDIPVVAVKIDADSVRPDIFLNNFGCKTVLIKTDRPLTAFEKFENEIRLSMERFNERKFLIAPGLNAKESLTDFFRSERLHYVADLVVVDFDISPETVDQEKQSKIYKLWTHKYLGNQNNTEMQMLDVWFSSNESFFHGNNLYGNKLRNQMGRLFKMATFQYEPYSIIDTSINKYKGSEMSSMLAFANYLNMTPEFVVNPEDYWGVINEDWTGNGLLGNLVNDKADIGFAALYTWEEEYHYLDLSKPLIRTGITCLAPAPKLAAGWLMPLYSFSYAMWCFVATTLIISILVHAAMFFLQAHPIHNSDTKTKSPVKYKNSVFVIYKIYLIQLVDPSEMPTGRSGTMFMGMIFVFSFFLTSTYSSGLATVMTIPRYDNAIDTVEDFINSDILWVGTHSDWVDSIEHAEDEGYQKIVRKFLAVADKTRLRVFSKTSKYAFALERLPHSNYAIGTYIQHDIIENYRLMKEDFYWEQAVIMARKSSILLPLLDDFILRIFEAGLIYYWQNEAVMLYMDSYVQKVVKYFTTNKQSFAVKLKWNHVSGTFAILLFGCLIATIIFILEVGNKWMPFHRV